MNRKKKSGFLTFCFSLLPGAGEMYLGYEKMGVSLMGMFFAVLGLGNLLNIGLFGYMAVVLWFYSFFHVHNLAGLTDAEYMNTKDEYLFHLDDLSLMNRGNVQKYRKGIAAVLIIIGILLVWNGVKAAILPYLAESVVKLLIRMEHTVPQIIVGGVILFAGFCMIKGKKEELEAEEADKTQGDEENGNETFIQ